VSRSFIPASFSDERIGKIDATPKLIVSALKRARPAAWIRQPKIVASSLGVE
jgi:hypothetical protein